ncbi:MAG TPA: DUF2061 domain-containing protein [Alphaproteobacteria bacterium]|nr:DUF2061 domain-containing protein [Alphaproteobacteria bacterium]
MLESRKRTLAKAVTWQCLGLLVTTALGWYFTGSAAAGGQFALVSSGLALVTYVMHERLWQAIRWGRGLPEALGAADAGRPAQISPRRRKRLLQVWGRSRLSSRKPASRAAA